MFYDFGRQRSYLKTVKPADKASESQLVSENKPIYNLSLEACNVCYMKVPDIKRAKMFMLGDMGFNQDGTLYKFKGDQNQNTACYGLSIKFDNEADMQIFATKLLNFHPFPY